EFVKADWTGDVLRGDLPGDDAPEHLHREGGHFPGLPHALAERRDGARTVQLYHTGRPHPVAFGESDAQTADGAALLHDARHAGNDVYLRAAPVEVDRQIALRGAAHLGNEISTVGDRRTVDRQDSIACTQARACAGAPGRHRLNHRVGVPGGEIEA